MTTEAKTKNDRIEYLKDLADNFGVDTATVFAIADMLGESEDHDGLISTLEDMSY